MLKSGFYLMDCMDGMKQFPDKFFDLAIVDPPYGINITGRKSGEGCKIGQSGKTYHAFDDTAIPDESYFKELFRVSKNQIIWGGNYFTKYLPPTSCWISWDKDRADGLDFADGELAWCSFKKPMRIYRRRWGGNDLDPSRREERIHPTQKPVEIIDRFVKALSYPGSVVLDFFAGSGTVGRVCISECRHCLMCDSDPSTIDFFNKHLALMKELFREENSN